MKYRYELTEDVVNYLLQAVNRVQISGVQQAQSLLQIVDILKSPLNADELEKEQLEELKAKYEKKEKK
jgi:hypothetical protein